MAFSMGEGSFPLFVTFKGSPELARSHRKPPSFCFMMEKGHELSDCS